MSDMGLARHVVYLCILQNWRFNMDHHQRPLNLGQHLTGWWFQPLWKYQSIGIIIPNIWKYEKCSNHQPVNIWYILGTKLTVDGLVLNSFRRKVHCFYLREVLMFLPCKHIGHPLPPCGSGCDGGGVVMQFGSQQILGLSLGRLVVKRRTGPCVYIHLYIYIHTIMCM